MDKRKETAALSEAELDALFQASSNEVPLPSGELFTRILADAADAQPEKRSAFGAGRRPGFWMGLRETLGGWAGVSGLAGAAAMGLLIGVFPPEALSIYSDVFIGGETVTDYIPGLVEVSFDG